MGEDESEIASHEIVHVPLGKNIMEVLAKGTPHFRENLLSLVKFVRRGYRLYLDEENEENATWIYLFDKLTG